MIVFALTDPCAACGSTRTYRLDDAGREEGKLSNCSQREACWAELARTGRLEAARLKPQVPTFLTPTLAPG